MAFVIKLNSSEALSFFGFFGMFFSLPNLNQIFINQVFPIIIENSTMYEGLFRVIYVVLIALITFESINWLISLFNKMQKTKNLNIDFNFYLLKIILFGLFGIISALVLNKILF